MRGNPGGLHPWCKNALIAAVVFTLLAAMAADACEPADDSLRASPPAFKATAGTTLYFTIPAIVNASPTLAIFNSADSAVRSYPIGGTGSGQQRWDGKDSSGSLVPEGAYYAVLTILSDAEPITQSCDMFVDNTAPATAISFSQSPGSGGSYTQGVTFSLTGSDAAGSGISSYHYNINNKGWKTWCSPVALNDAGHYVLRYKAIDCAGNYEIQTIEFDVTAAPGYTPTEAPVPTPKLPTPTPEPDTTLDEQNFAVNPESVQTHDDGSITYETGEVTCTAGDKSLAGSVGINLTHAPSGANLLVSLRSGLHYTQASQFKLAITGSKGEIKDYAGVLVVDKQNLQNGVDIASATITMKVSKAWVDAHGGTGTVKILRYSEGVAESLDTRCVGLEGDLMVFEALSPHGLSEFALAAVDVPAAGAVADTTAQPSGSPIGSWAYVGVLAIIAAFVGLAGYFVGMKQ